MFVYIRSAAFVIVVTQKLVLKQSKNFTGKCTETLSPHPSIQYLLDSHYSSCMQYIKMLWNVPWTIRYNLDNPLQLGQSVTTWTIRYNLDNPLQLARCSFFKLSNNRSKLSIGEIKSLFDQTYK